MSDLQWNSEPEETEEQAVMGLEDLRLLAEDLDPEEFDEPVQEFLKELDRVQSADELKQAATLLLQDEVDFAPELADLGVEPDMGLIGLLLAAGADVNALNAYGMAPLHLAARYGYAPIIDRLLAAGAKRELRDREGRFAADLATDPALAEHLEPKVRGEWNLLPPEIEDVDAEPEEGCHCGHCHDEGCGCCHDEVGHDGCRHGENGHGGCCHDVGGCD